MTPVPPLAVPAAVGTAIPGSLALQRRQLLSLGLLSLGSSTLPARSQPSEDSLVLFEGKGYQLQVPASFERKDKVRGGRGSNRAHPAL